MLNNDLFSCENIERMHETMKRLYEAAAQLREISGPTELANALNESPQVINNWERRGMSKAGILSAQEKLGVSAGWLMSGFPPMATVGAKPDAERIVKRPINATEAPLFDVSKRLRKEEDLPQEHQSGASRPAPPTLLQYPVDPSKFRRVYVVGRAQGGMPERIWTDGDYPVGATDEYAELATQDPYAFISPVVGDSMFPRFMPGEYVLVEPSTPPDLEDTVMIRLETGETMLKRLLSRRNGHVRVGSWNEPTIYTFREDEVTWMYYVAHPVPAKKIHSRM